MPSSHFPIFNNWKNLLVLVVVLLLLLRQLSMFKTKTIYFKLRIYRIRIKSVAKTKWTACFGCSWFVAPTSISYILYVDVFFTIRRQNFPIIDIQYPHESHESMWKLTWAICRLAKLFFGEDETIQWQIESFFLFPHTIRRVKYKFRNANFFWMK